MKDLVVREHRVRIDLGPQILSVECPEDVTGDPAQAEPPLSKTIGPLRSGRFVSASVLAQKAKLFDDGLFAAVELAAQGGQGKCAGKARLLEKVAQRLSGMEGPRVGEAASILLAACELGGLRVAQSAGIAGAVRQTLTDFLADELRSKPLGFYTWSPELEAIFRQDRMLQTEIKDPIGVEILARAIHGTPEARALYDQHLGLVERLTNPLAWQDLRPLLKSLDGGGTMKLSRKVSFLPPSESPEGALVKRLFGAKPVPADFNLADELAKQILAGDLWLTPKAESGWYDHVLWSLEPLIVPGRMPEGARLDLGERYKTQLVDLFKGILALARETHVKQVESPQAGCGPPERRITIAPELSAEPLPTHYLRRAIGYRLVRDLLEGTFGEVALAEMHRLTPDGPGKMSLARELTLMEALFNGAYVTTMRELGLEPDPKLAAGRTGGADADASRFAGWAADQTEDTDLFRDSRMMVPVFRDVERGLTKVWAFLGWSSRPLDVSFKVPPKVTVTPAGLRKPGAVPPAIEFESVRYSLIYPVTVEAWVSKLMNRAEFAAHCDLWKTRKAIVENLK